MILIANRQLAGSYGSVRTGDRFSVTDPDIIKELIRNGLVTVPSVTYETKVIRAAPVVAAQPFRDVRDAINFQQVPILETSDTVVPVADVEPKRTPNRRRRRKRSS